MTSHPKTRPLIKIELKKQTNFGNPHGPQCYANGDKFDFEVIDLGINATCKTNGQCILIPWSNITGTTYARREDMPVRVTSKAG